LILFLAKDDLSSIALDETIDDIPPKEILVCFIVAKKKLGKLSLALEYATAAGFEKPFNSYKLAG
jgi:hypothetical protein